MISSDLFVIQKYLIHFYSFFPPPTPSIRLPRCQALAQRVWALGCVSGGSTSPASGSGLLSPPWHTSRAGEAGTGLSVPVSGRTGDICHRLPQGFVVLSSSLLAVVSGLSHFLLLSTLAWRKVQVFLMQSCVNPSQGTYVGLEQNFSACWFAQWMHAGKIQPHLKAGENMQKKIGPSTQR